MTPQELRAELEYRVLERLGMKYAAEPVSPEQERQVRIEVTKEIGELRRFYENQAKCNISSLPVPQQAQACARPEQ